MVNGTSSVDTNMLSQSARQMGDILMNAQTKKSDLIENMLGVKAQAQTQSASPPGVGENIDAIA